MTAHRVHEDVAAEQMLPPRCDEHHGASQFNEYLKILMRGESCAQFFASR